MVGGHEKVLDIILLNGLHALDSLAASVLAPEIIYIHTLDVAQMGHGNDGVLVRNQSSMDISSSYPMAVRRSSPYLSEIIIISSRITVRSFFSSARIAFNSSIFA